jgi:hypothetical protein
MKPLTTVKNAIKEDSQNYLILKYFEDEYSIAVYYNVENGVTKDCIVGCLQDILHRLTKKEGEV